MGLRSDPPQGDRRAVAVERDRVQATLVQVQVSPGSRLALDDLQGARELLRGRPLDVLDQMRVDRSGLGGGHG